MADSELNLHIKTTGDATAANQAAAAVHKFADEEKAAAVAADQLKKSTENLAPVVNQLRAKKEELGTTTKNTGQNMLQMAYFADDLQYGLKGIVNQIPQVLQALGLGAGLAGVVSIAAVGLNVLTNNLDLFGEASDEAAKKAKALRESTDYAAGAAREHATQVNAEQASAKKLEDSIKSTTELYREQVAEIDRATAAIIRKIQAEQAMADAKKDQALADIDIAEASGKITAVDAEYQRRAVQSQSAKEKFDRDQRISQQQAAQEADTANAKAKEANILRKEAEDLQINSRGALGSKDKEALKKKREALEAEIKDRQATVDSGPDTEWVDENGKPTAPGNPKARLVTSQTKAAAKKRLGEAQDELRGVNDSLTADETSRRLNGGRSKEQVAKEAEKLREDAAQRDKESRDAIRRRDEIKEGMGNRAALFPEQQNALDKRTDARVIQIQAKDEQAAAREAAKEGRGNAANARGAETIADHASQLGANPRFVEQLRNLAEKARAGKDNNGAEKEILELLKLIMSSKADDGKEMQRLKEEVRKLADQIKNGRNGN